MEEIRRVDLGYEAPKPFWHCYRAIPSAIHRIDQISAYGVETMSTALGFVDYPITKNAPLDTVLTANRAERLFVDIRELAPEVAARAAEIEAGRRIPLDLAEALKSIGVFRMFVPQSHDGLELDLPTALEIIAALGRIDGSVGWTAMIGSGSGIFAPLLPRGDL